MRENIREDAKGIDPKQMNFAAISSSIEEIVPANEAERTPKVKIETISFEIESKSECVSSDYKTDEIFDKSDTKIESRVATTKIDVLSRLPYVTAASEAS